MLSALCASVIYFVIIVLYRSLIVYCIAIEERGQGYDNDNDGDDFDDDVMTGSGGRSKTLQAFSGDNVIDAVNCEL